jgi:glycosyltransferase involved in cell wall biosynthesis
MSEEPNETPVLTIIMCAHNEMGRIQPALDDLTGTLDGRSHSSEIVILDNASTDGTREWLGALDLPNTRVVLNDTNLGKGGSIRKGIGLSRGRYVVVHDPDMEYRAEDVWRLLDAALDEGASMVLGSRVLGGSVSYRYAVNYLGVRFLTFAINRLYGSRLTDSATAMKLLNGELARSLNLESSGFDLDFEIVARTLRLGHNIVERRVQYFPRTRAQGKKLRAWRDGLMALRVILRDRILPRRRFLLAAAAAGQRASGVEGLQGDERLP